MSRRRLSGSARPYASRRVLPLRQSRRCLTTSPTSAFRCAPLLGRDDLGRHVLEYIPGQVADALAPLTATGLRRLGAFIGELHDAADSFKPPSLPQWNVVIAPDREELICHHDLARWNLVRDGDRWVFIDWDGAGPGSRLRDE